MAVLCRLSYSSGPYAGHAMIKARGARRPTICALAAVATAVVLAGCGGDAAKRTLVIETDEGEVEVAVEVADNLWERARGLMGREELDEDAGMVFLVDEPTSTPFWMKDTLIPLSVAFWDRERRIFRIRHMEPCRAEPCPYYWPGGPWIGALEVNRGFFEEHGVEVGDRVSLGH
jgi:uncharacterized membrane protein (UPF0127 family)